MQTFTKDDVLHMLRAHISYENSQRDLAKEIGVSEPFISMVLAGKKQPSKNCLKFLGLKKVTAYVRASRRRSKKRGYLTECDMHEDESI
jgi:hypothetical protein